MSCKAFGATWQRLSPGSSLQQINRMRKRNVTWQLCMRTATVVWQRILGKPSNCIVRSADLTLKCNAIRAGLTMYDKCAPSLALLHAIPSAALHHAPHLSTCWYQVQQRNRGMQRRSTTLVYRTAAATALQKMRARPSDGAPKQQPKGTVEHRTSWMRCKNAPINYAHPRGSNESPLCVGGAWRIVV